MPRCDPLLLEASLADRLSERDEERLAAHLEQCASCRQQLDQLAGDGPSWERISDLLRIAAASPGTAFYAPVGVAEAATHDDPFTDADADDADSYIDFAVDFLEPARVAGSLGQLGEIDVLEIIGRGGMGIVLKGFQPELNRPVAVKVLAPHLATSGAARKRFAREAQAAAAIMHANVMPILTVSSNSKLPYLVMPYVACESLQQRLDREGPLPIVDVLRIGLQIAHGLAAAHAQGLIHRDVKPANILLEKGVDRVLLTDFGLARAVDDASLTRTGVIAGTPQYMSPEQARGDAVDARSDQFSLGSVLYAMCTGRAPFRAETSYGILRRVTDGEPRGINEINAEVPRWLTGIVSQLHAKGPSDRFGSVKEVGKLLEGCLAHLQQPAAVQLPEVCRTMLLPDAIKVTRWQKLWQHRWTVSAATAGAMFLAVLLWAMVDDPKVRQDIASVVPPLPAVAQASVNEGAETKVFAVPGENQPPPVPGAEPPASPGLPIPPEMPSSTAVDIPAWDDAAELELQLLAIEAQLLEQEIKTFWTRPDAVPGEEPTR